MPEEIVASEEVEKAVVEEQEPKTEEEGFVKEDEVVSTGKHNQTIRKLRESELEKRELEKQLAEAKSEKPVVEEKEEEDFFKEEEKETEKVDPAKLIDEKLKPINDAFAKREANDRKIQRTAFFEAHPEYLSNSEKWQGLLDEMDNSLNPNSKDDYYTQLEKTHRIISSEIDDTDVETKKKEIAGDAASGGDGAERVSVKDEFTAEDRKHQKEWGVSDEGMRAYKAKIASGAMRLL